MSAIFGQWNPDRRTLEPRHADNALDALRHRGAAASWWIEPGIVLGSGTVAGKAEGHRSTSDPTPGAIVGWDGRLNNRDQLLGSLADRATGVTPDCSDDRLISAGYARWGHDVLDHLVGDFAFALFARS